MKFDVIYGNPPFNKGIVKPNHDVHSHQAMNSEREGYIGFFIQSVKMLRTNGSIYFITPGKFMIGPGAHKFRSWLIQSSNLSSIKSIPNDGFDEIGIDKLCITTIEHGNYKGLTSVTHVNGCTVPMTIKTHPHFVIPDFGSKEIYCIYMRLVNFQTIPFMDTDHIGEYGPNSKQHFQRDKTEQFSRIVATSIDKFGKIEYDYTDLMASDSSRYWRLITKMSFARVYGLIAPGEEHDYSMWGCRCKDEQDANTLLLWTTTKLYKILWQAFNSTRHTHVVIRNIPRPNKYAQSEFEIYSNFGLTETDIKAIRGYQLDDNSSR